VLADDEVLMREGLAGLLERSGFEVVGQCGNASELIGLVRERRPDLVIVDTLARIVKGASVIDPALVRELIAARGAVDPLDVLSPREREVLALMAEGRSNAGIAHALWITESTVEKHVRAILRKLRLPAGEDDQRRVLAVVTYLNAR
jgi:DNA-binding NarL/FixJ family response regulator